MIPDRCWKDESVKYSTEKGFNKKQLYESQNETNLKEGNDVKQTTKSNDDNEHIQELVNNETEDSDEIVESKNETTTGGFKEWVQCKFMILNFMWWLVS